MNNTINNTIVDGIYAFNQNMSNGMLKVVNCDTLQVDLNNKVSLTSRVLIILILVLSLFQGWAIMRIMNSRESQDKKTFLISFCLIMVNGLICLFGFYILYWIYIAKIDF